MVGKGGLPPAPVKESTYLREQRGQATLPDYEPPSRITHHVSRIFNLFLLAAPYHTLKVEETITRLQRQAL